MRKYFKILAQLLLKGYSFYHIYGQNPMDEEAAPVTGLQFKLVEKKEIDDSGEEMIVEQAWYHGQSTYAYACIEDSRILGVCFFWFGERYARRNFWPLADQEAKLVQIFVLPEMRGRGIGKGLIQFATQDMFLRKFTRVYARVWRSNIPSSQAFQNAGWKRVATVIEIFLRGRSKPLRLELRRSF